MKFEEIVSKVSSIYWSIKDEEHKNDLFCTRIKYLIETLAGKKIAAQLNIEKEIDYFICISIKSSLEPRSFIKLVAGYVDRCQQIANEQKQACQTMIYELHNRRN